MEKKKQPVLKLKDIGPVRNWEIKGETLSLETIEAQVHITALSPELVRMHMVPWGIAPPKRSYAVAVSPDHWPGCHGDLEESNHTLIWQTHCSNAKGITVEITKNPFCVSFKRADGSLIAASTPTEGISVSKEETGDLSAQPVGSSWALQAPEDVRFYGFGQKQGFLDKRGQRLSLWATDEPLHILSNDELYQAIPFALTVDDKGKSTGVFVDCTGLVTYDLAKSQPHVWTIKTMLPTLDAYVFAGPKPKDVIRQYTELTGRMELPPLWALGYQQSRYSYYPEKRVRKIAAEMRAREIPCDVIYLDIHYMDGYRVFTWDQERFPNPHQMVEDLAKQGFKTVVIVDPGVKVDGCYQVFQEGVHQRHFITYPDGELFIGKVWPGSTAFPDFLREKTRCWWVNLHRELLEDVGIAGIWNDMNEPSCFARRTLPDEVLQGEDGQQVPHAHVHNAYGQTMAMATYDALKRLRPNKRPFLLTRSGYAGIQRYAAVWMGDNHSWWEHLHMSIPMCLGMGLSGVPFVGTDVGGFQGDSQGELFVRWIQMGAFMPFFRNHSALGTGDQEPWSFGPEVEDIVRKFLRLRYRLLPFLYNEFYQASKTGLPIIRPLLLEYPDDPEVFHLSDQFLVGSDLLVCPVYQPGRKKRMVYLPAGQWIDFWTGRRFHDKQHVVAPAPLNRLPLFVKAGAILPLERALNHTGERDGGKLFLHVYVPSVKAEASESNRIGGQLELYEDAGEGFAYKKGEWSKTFIRLEQEKKQIKLKVGRPQGKFRPPRKQVIVHLYVNEHWQALLPSSRVKAAGVILNVEKNRPQLGDQPENPRAFLGSLGELVVMVPTPAAGEFLLEIEI